ncbi:MAG: hypothetical protein R3E01_34680 [Pirellulaceae bacterium]|nr:hypothetical protein [Planctomycetales bacterium]
MTQRERWIVYPLLFMSLAFGLRGDLFPRQNAKFEVLTCQGLRVVDNRGKALVEVGIAGGQGGSLRILNKIGSPVVVLEPDFYDQHGVVTIADAASNTLAKLGAHANFPQLEFVETKDAPRLVVGADAQRHVSGLMTVDDEHQILGLADEHEPPDAWGTLLPWERRGDLKRIMPPADEPDQVDSADASGQVDTSDESGHAEPSGESNATNASNAADVAN